MAISKACLFLSVLVLLSLCLLPSPGMAGAARTKIVLLGTGSPVPDPDRSGPAIAVVVDGHAYLVDSGTGCVRQATKAYQEKGVEGLSITGLNILFLTHLHSDHTLGYPDVMLTPWDHRVKPLEVYGPAGTRDMTENLLKAYALDIEVRTEGLQRTNLKTVTPNVHEIEPGLIYKDSLVTVTAFKVKHGSFPNSFGFTFVTPDKTIVLSGDTSPDKSLIEQARNADLLIHEVYAMAKYDNVPPETQKYLQAFHTSTRQLAQIAGEAKPKLLVPIHMLGSKDLPFGTIEKEIRAAGYHGKIAESRDLSIY